jgi:putative colanic acid biosynthesis UDP-glucose lipid carrier transferase
LRDTTASIYYVPDLQVFDLVQTRSSSIQGIPVIAMCETPFYGFRGVGKRVTDIVISASILLMAAPVLAVIAVLVKFSSPGPVIFRQRRYGLNGEEILVYKFRTMRVVEDGNAVLQARRADSRTTPVGRFLRRYSLDELPQLINVLQGRMSLVGPRPHAVAHNEMYRKLIKGYMVRHKVLPGITGLAQVNGMRGETRTVEQMEARVRYDIEYLRTWSIALDLKILAKTAVRVLNDARAY